MIKFELTKDEINRVAGWGDYAKKTESFYKCYEKAAQETGVTMDQFEKIYPIIRPKTYTRFQLTNELVDKINHAMNCLPTNKMITPTDLLKASGHHIYYRPSYDEFRNKFTDFIHAYSVAHPDQVEMFEIETCGQVAIRAYRRKN